MLHLQKLNEWIYNPVVILVCSPTHSTTHLAWVAPLMSYILTLGCKRNWLHPPVQWMKQLTCTNKYFCLRFKQTSLTHLHQLLCFIRMFMVTWIWPHYTALVILRFENVNFSIGIQMKMLHIIIFRNIYKLLGCKTLLPSISIM